MEYFGKKCKYLGVNDWVLFCVPDEDVPDGLIHCFPLKMRDCVKLKSVSSDDCFAII